MKRFVIIPTLAMLVLALAPAAALADIYINGGRSLTGGPTMVRDPRAPLPSGCHRESEDTTRCDYGIKMANSNRIHFVTVHDVNSYCVVDVAVTDKPGQPGMHKWHAFIVESHGVNCALTWRNENTVTVHAR